MFRHAFRHTFRHGLRHGLRHVFRHVFGHATSALALSLCSRSAAQCGAVWWCDLDDDVGIAGTATVHRGKVHGVVDPDLFLDMRLDKHLDVCLGVCLDMCLHKCIDMHVDMCSVCH